ncbi:hypothetical protein KUTeg_006030 [Tegillarca granosa]|uniref:Interference hedgehog n=1 Tax=Tegillarca granosa TaxID=220873 RepID=A0ABQ9FIL0_TEGGR|nr:hypothetical protein KUTeg_006030 [Tegillarca granosa]
MMLEYRELPKVIADTSRVSINPEESVRLHCIVRGQPVPEVVWYHNAVPKTGILQVYNGGTTYNINDIQIKHAGYYQCMSSNEEGVGYATIKVEVKEQTVAPSVGNQNTEDHTSSVGNTDENRGSSRPKKGKNRKGSAGRRRKDRRRRKNRRRKGKKDRNKFNQFIGDEAKIKLVPPTAPDVNQLSDTSVKVNWSVPENDGLPITFFRVQYKIVKPKKGEWKTGDVIPNDVRVQEVSNLKAGGTYKFRIAAVYSNNDNKVGPNSAKYTLHLAPFNKPKPPENKPAIVEVKPVEYEENVDKIFGLNIKWNYQQRKTSPIEGFFLYYKPFSSTDDYKKLALLQAGVRVHLLNNLTPNTEYSIKLQCFNAAGTSKNSTPVVKRTGPGPFVPIISPVGPEKSLKPEPQKPDTTVKSVVSQVEESSKSGAQSSELLYMIVGIVLGVMMLFLIVFMFMCWWKQRQQRNMMCNFNAMNDATGTKFLDPAQRIYADSMKKKYVNSGYGVNGSVPNGHVPNAYTKMNINVNPLSDVDLPSVCNGHGGNNQYQVSTFVPNGTATSLSQESDSNFNKINRSLNNSLQCSVNHSVHSVHSPDSLGSGEAPACPPSPATHGSSYLQNGFGLNSDSQEGYSNRSCDQLSESHHGYLSNSVDFGTKHSNDGSLPSDSGGNHIGKHKRRRKRVPQREHTTRDQATNTDLSSNEGTLELSTCNKVPCVTQISGHNSPSMRTLSSDASHSAADYPQLSQGV